MARDGRVACLSTSSRGEKTAGSQALGEGGEGGAQLYSVVLSPLALGGELGEACIGSGTVFGVYEKGAAEEEEEEEEETGAFLAPGSDLLAAGYAM